MTEKIEKQPKEETVEQLLKVEDIPLSALDEPIQGDMNPIVATLPSVSEKQIIGGIGGKYLSQVTKTNGFNTASGSFVDVTDLSITADIRNRRVLLMFSGQISNNTDAETTILTFEIDDTDQGNLIANTFSKPTGEQQEMFQASMMLITSILIGTHTFKVQMKTTNASTGYLGSYNTNKVVFSAVELSD